MYEWQLLLGGEKNPFTTIIINLFGSGFFLMRNK